jgi:CRP-like cAMP-binding protein
MVDTEQFVRLVPLLSLTQADRARLAKVSSVASFAAGQSVFSRGELARTHAYLLEGELELVGDQRQWRLTADSGDAKFSISPGMRRNCTATCITAAKVLFVDAETLDLMLTWGQTGGVDAEVIEQLGDADDSHDWMTALLQSKAFLRVPPANISELFAHMQAVRFEAGEMIIEINTAGDYYYIITHGTVQVVLPDIDGSGEEELAQLGVGKGFGEEALVSGAPRNASVRALTPCVLMRLSSRDFASLLKAPLLPEVSTSAVSAHQLLDVRSVAEFDHHHLPDAINLPLSRIRERAHTLNPEHEYWVYCDTGRRSASATFLLNQNGLNAKHYKNILSR